METLQALEPSQLPGAPQPGSEMNARHAAAAEREADWDTVVRSRDGMLRSRVWRVLKRLKLRARPELVEELMQEVYCRLFEDGAARLRRCRDGLEGSMDAYLGLIAERTVFDQVRLAGALKRGGAEIVRQPRLRLEKVPDPGWDPERRALCRDECRWFLGQCRSLRGVGSGRRNVWVIRLALFRGYSSREIARAAGGRMTPRSVDLLVHRIRRRLARNGFSLQHR